MTSRSSNQYTVPGDQTESRTLVLTGQVQGVGYRPFVYRLAMELDIRGWVRNQRGQVEILAQGPRKGLSEFEHRLIADAPPLARPRLLKATHNQQSLSASFSIAPSNADATAHIHLPPDYFTCPDCLRELRDPSDRRHRYPFINCTQCGPRYTLIRSLPYDRPNTTMAEFALCPACRREYENPMDRRFHAEPVACPECGPELQLNLTDTGAVAGDSNALIARAADALGKGAILAVKGVGGYHLMCDASNDAAIGRLRRRKPRPDKPLAVLAPELGADGLDGVRAIAYVGDVAGAQLTSPERSIVLLQQRHPGPLSGAVAPGLDEVGVMLPYSPLHYLLLEAFGGSLVATSANLGGEPVLTDGNSVEARLANVCDGYLHHNRPIQRPADDPVIRIIDGAPRPLRMGRGNAPTELDLAFQLSSPILAAGGHMKNTVALAWDRRAVVSPHIGDLEAPRSVDTFARTMADLQSLYEVTPGYVAYDAHPGYASHQWARKCGLKGIPVWHHQAHAAALAGEHPREPRWLTFTWDGVGLGPDGTLWGGESLLGAPGQWQRFASMRPLRLPGGNRAGRAPWRSALAVCWETGIQWDTPVDDRELLQQAWQRGLNSPQTSAVGRLFDAAAALTGLAWESSFEGQGPMQLEAAARVEGMRPVELPLERDAGGLRRTDWSPLVQVLLDERRSPGERAGLFHVTMATALLRQAQAAREEHGDFAVGLTGGVFQNRLLTETVLALLRGQDFRVFVPRLLPCNDAALSFGQIMEAAACLRQQSS